MSIGDLCVAPPPNAQIPDRPSKSRTVARGCHADMGCTLQARQAPQVRQARSLVPMSGLGGAVGQGGGHELLVALVEDVH